MRNKELLKYGGLATQMIATLGVAIFIGYRLDKYFKFRFPIFLIAFALIVLISMFWKVYLDSTKKNKEND